MRNEDLDMRKILTTNAIALALSTTSAFSADLPSYKAPPPAAPVFSWTGAYAGLNAGYGFGTNNNSNVSLLNSGSWSVTTVTNSTFVIPGSYIGAASGANSTSISQSGFVGGAQFGFNYQINQNFVVGFETDIQGTAMRGNSNGFGIFGSNSNTNNSASSGVYANQNGAFVTTVQAGIDYIGTARGRVGYLLGPSLLLYGTAGLAYGGAWANVVTNGASTTTAFAYASGSPTAPYPNVSQTYLGGGRSNNLLVGYSAGGGVEWMFMPNWSLKGEALYYNLGNMNVSTTSVAGASYGQALVVPNVATAQVYTGSSVLSGQTSVNYQGVIARAGLNYHFNFGSAPVVAKF
jgi:outer membrane immunogenic protein